MFDQQKDEQCSKKETIEAIEVSKDEDDSILVITPLKTKIKKMKYGTSENAYKIFKDILQYEEYELKDREHFWVMGVDAEGYICCIYIVAIGHEDFVILKGIDIFDLAIAKKSKDIVIIQNDPDYDYPMPSQEDIDFTNRLYHACLQFGLRVSDHLIIGDRGFHSFDDRKMMLHIMHDYEYQPYHNIKDRLAIEREEYTKKHVEENTEIIASNMLDSGVAIDIVISCTGLDRAKVEAIKKTIESVEEIKKDL